jgi:protocatechuate 3,4-dioxygenase beta subunit
MAGQAKTLLILGGVLVAAVAAAVWLGMSAGTDSPPGQGGASATPGGPARPEPSPGAAAAARPKKQGTAALFGEVRRTAGHEPVLGQEIRLAPERGEAWTVVTDPQGGFRFDKIPHGGPYELSAAAKGCGTIRIPGIALDRNEQRNVGTLWLDPSVKLTVRVRSGADAPVEGAVVRAFPVPKWVDWDWSKALAQIGQTPISVAKTTTNAAGEALFPEMAVGEWTFTATKDGFATSGARGVTLRSDEEPRPVTIWLATGYPLDGRVLAADRKPVAGALVMAAAPDSGWDTAAAPMRARVATDAEGRYAFTALQSGDVLLWVGRPGGAPSPAATLRVPLVPHYDIVLKGGGLLTGKVTLKETGEPVEGATVRTSSWESGEAHGAEAVTDALGTYSLEMAAGAVNQIDVEKEGLVQIPVVARAGMQRQAVLHEGAGVVRDIEMRRGARLTGVVKGDGRPLAGVRVLVHVGTPEEGFNQKAATTGADGRYEYSSVVTGDFLVLAEKEGWYLPDAPVQWWEAAQDPNAAREFRVTIPATGDATKDLEMKRGSAVTGTVVGPDGEPLAGARVGGPGAAVSSPSGADGAFRLEGVTPGPEVTLTCSKDGYVAAAKPFPVAPDENATGIVVRMLRAPRIRGTVSVASGGPIRDARVLLAQQNEGEDSSPWSALWKWQNATRLPVRTDGSYDGEIPFAATGKMLVRAVSVDHPPADAKPVDLVEGQEFYDVNLALEEGVALAGKVVARSGAGVGGAEVSIAAHMESPDSSTVYYGGGGNVPVWAVTESDGSFSIPHLASGRYDVRATAEGFVTSQTVADLAAGAPFTVTLSPEMSIEGTVALADGSPVEGVEVKAAEAEGSGRAAAFGGISRGEQSATSDAKGAFRVTGLGEGRYTIEVEAPWGAQINVRGKRVEGIAAGSTGVKITLDAGAQIAGHVVDAKRRPVPNAWIQANPMPKENDDSEGNEWRGTQSRADGSFTLLGLGAGPYGIDVSASGGAGGFRPKHVDDVAVGAKDLEILVDEGLSISGVVVSADGKSVGQMALRATPVDSGGSPFDVESGASRNGGNAWTDMHGKFAIAGLAPGAYRVEVAPWGGSNQGWVVEPKQEIQAGATGVRLVVGRGASLAGVVVDESGKPIAGAMLNVGSVPNLGAWRSAVSKGDGAFEVTGLASEGTYTIQVSAQGRVPSSLDGVSAGATSMRIVLVKGLTASGRVTDAAGKAMASASVNLVHPDGEHNNYAQTDAEGRFTADGLVDGTYEAQVYQQFADGNGEWKPCGQLKAGETGVELRVAR